MPSKPLSASGSSFITTFEKSKLTLLSTTELGTYYIAVPAGTPLTVYDGDKTIKSTSRGLKARKYYELVVEDYFEIMANQDPNQMENYYATFYSSKSGYSNVPLSL